MGAPRYSGSPQGDEKRTPFATTMDRYADNRFIEGDVDKEAIRIYKHCIDCIKAVQKSGEKITPARAAACWYPFDDWKRACLSTPVGGTAMWMGKEYPNWPFAYGGAEQFKNHFKNNILARAMAAVEVPKGIIVPKI
jgi:hypothetical protein